MNKCPGTLNTKEVPTTILFNIHSTGSFEWKFLLPNALITHIPTKPWSINETKTRIQTP
jgi:hypothetical protein